MSKAITWKLAEVEKSKIKINPNNPKIFDEKGFARLEKLRAKYGTIFDGILNADLSLIDGHSRLKQSPEGKGMYFIPSRKLSEKDYKELNALFDLAKAGNPDTLLIEEMFGDEFMEEWDIDSVKKPEVVEDDFDGKPPVKPITVLGDLYEMNDHRVLCGDSTNGADVSKLMGKELWDMIFTDPPYAVNYGNDHERHKLGGRLSKKNSKSSIINDQLSVGEISEIIWSPAFKNLYDFAKEDCSFYMTMCQGGDQMMMMMMMSQHWQVKHELIWVKSSPVFSMGRLDYDYKHEPIIFGWKKKHNFYGKGEFTKSVWDIPKPSKSDDHPTMKPVALVANALNNSSKENDLIGDLFIGSGTTIIAADQLNRICYGQEIAPNYCDVIVARYVKYKRETGGSLVIKKNGRQLSDKEIQKYLDNTNAEK